MKTINPYQTKRTLIIVDLQNDFCPGGALPVHGGRDIVPTVNKLMEYFDLVIATQDWHPKEHKSFAANHPGKNVGDIIDLSGLKQILWPVHCVQGTYGAELVKELNISKINKIIQKGTDPEIDSYSGFFDNGHKKSTGLHNYLLNEKITDVYIVGLATDYCVKFTALDAANLGFNTFVIEDACRGVNINSDDTSKALIEMTNSNVRIIKSNKILK